MLRIIPETPDDGYEVELLLDQCFAPGRTALSSYRLREEVPPVGDLCRLIRDDYNAVIAAIRFWPVRIGLDGLPALLLGPIAVHPTRQGEGLAALLIGATLEDGSRSGWARVILVGDAPYYGRFGFSRAPSLDFPPPTNPERILARELRPGGMDGVAGKVRKW